MCYSIKNIPVDVDTIHQTRNKNPIIIYVDTIHQTIN